MLQVIALPFVFIPISTLNYVGVPATKTNQISSLSNFARNLGGSAGTALLTTFIARTAQVHQSALAANVVPGSAAYNAFTGPGERDADQAVACRPQQPGRQPWARPTR